MPRGRKPKPVALKLLAGNPGNRPARAPSTYPPGVPDPPGHLSAAARAVWDTTVSEMRAAGTLTRADGAVLAAFAVAVADVAELTKQIDAEGLLLRVPIFERYGKQVGERVTAHPAAKLRDQITNRVRQLADSLGLTPASRTRVDAVAAATGKPPNKVELIRERIAAIRAAAPADPAPLPDEVKELAARLRAEGKWMPR